MGTDLVVFCFHSKNRGDGPHGFFDGCHKNQLFETYSIQTAFGTWDGNQRDALRMSRNVKPD